MRSASAPKGKVCIVQSGGTTVEVVPAGDAGVQAAFGRRMRNLVQGLAETE